MCIERQLLSLYVIMVNVFNIAILLVSALLSAPASNSIPAESLGDEQYEVRYIMAGITSKVADATISFEKGTRDGKAVLHSHAAIRASSIFRLFMDAEYIADAYLTQDRQDPVYYFNPVKKGGKEGKFECVYDSKTKTITSVFQRPPKDAVTNTYPMDGLSMDLLSLLVYVRYHDIPANSPLSMHLLMGGKYVAATLTNQGADSDKYPGAERFLLKMIDGGLMENGSGKEITVWRSTGNDRRILGLETSLSSGVMTVAIKE